MRFFNIIQRIEQKVKICYSEKVEKSAKDCRLAVGHSLKKGGGAMNYVTYTDLIQIGILIVAVIALFMHRK